MKPVLLALLAGMMLAPSLWTRLVPEPVPVVQTGGQQGPPIIPLNILINFSDLAAIPMTGSEWTNVENWSAMTEAPNPGGNNSDHDVIALACGLRWKRAGLTLYREKARDYISAVMPLVQFTNPPTIPHPSYDVLAIGRNILSYVLAADLIGLQQWDPSFDASFRTWLQGVRSQTWSCNRTLQAIHELRPNNEGLVGGATRIAIDMYLNDGPSLQDLKDAKKVFHAWVGNTTLHSGFEFGGGNPPPPRDNSWQSTTDPSQYRGISPVGATLVS